MHSLHLLSLDAIYIIVIFLLLSLIKQVADGLEEQDKRDTARRQHKAQYTTGYFKGIK